MQRQCVFIQGEADWCQKSAESLWHKIDTENSLWLAANTDSSQTILAHKQAQSQLGKEFELIVFDATEQFSPDSFGAIVGTLTAGGIMLVLLAKETTSLWQQRFQQIAAQYSQENDHFYFVQQDESLSTLSLSKQQKISNDKQYKSLDQEQAVEAILKVVHGHRRRPLVISSDRGRGKSAALGIAAAELIKQGKQKIIVTAPSMATTDTLFEHAGRLLPQAKYTQGHIQQEQAEIKFVAPDALLDSAITADLLLVDEAAAIPTSMLEKLLNKFSRIVFATTLHGYEGTGRGFVIRFQKILDQTTPSWRTLQMSTPIRWAEDDQLEAFSFQSLLLNASPVDDELITAANADACEFEHVDRTELVNDEQSLKELFGLMVLAHYRTRPSDLQMMLDREDVSVYVLRYQGHIVASAWLVAEGGIDESISSAVYAGNRRLKGHLLPQSLLAHVGIPTAGALSYQRIIRIAVHPAIQSRGIGQKLLRDIEQHLETKQCDLLGASFAVSIELLNFWHRSDFIPVRLGLHQDDVSGSHAVMMLKANSEQGHKLVEQAQERLSEQWSYSLSSHLKQVEAKLLIAVSQLISASRLQLSPMAKQEISAFAFEQRGFEFSQYSLALWLREQLNKSLFLQLGEELQALCLKTILQQQDWAEICETLPYTGKKQALSALREAVRILLELNKFHDEKQY
ncbi:hypothetical protein A9Q79_05305 [Methylophaga sp. 42_25_T18]|nr:hypothetical protein A9Q79_05305 [Methylophaga sp. 42_25_T18]